MQKKMKQTNLDSTFRKITTLTLTFSLGATIFTLNQTKGVAKNVKHDIPLKETAIVEKEEVIKREKVSFMISSTVVESKPVFKLIREDLTTFNLTNPSHLSPQQIDKIVAGTELEGLGWAYVEAEKRYNVNALYLLSHSILESGWGKSKIAQTKNNLFGFRAYDSSPVKSAKSFQTKADCILIVAEYISKEYLNKDGEHYNGPTLNGMGKKYASDNSWSIKIAQIMNDIQHKVEKI